MRVDAERALRRFGRFHHLPQHIRDGLDLGIVEFDGLRQFVKLSEDPTVLYPRVGNEQPERMASPLIVKPLCLANGKAVPVIVRLDVPPFTAIALTRNGRKAVVGIPWPLTAVRRSNLATYPNSPLAGSPLGSAIEAFLAFVQNPINKFTRC